jgi:hypothetical protein
MIWLNMYVDIIIIRFMLCIFKSLCNFILIIMYFVIFNLIKYYVV